MNSGSGGVYWWRLDRTGAIHQLRTHVLIILLAMLCQSCIHLPSSATSMATVGEGEWVTSRPPQNLPNALSVPGTARTVESRLPPAHSSGSSTPAVAGGIIVRTGTLSRRESGAGAKDLSLPIGRERSMSIGHGDLVIPPNVGLVLSSSGTDGTAKEASQEQGKDSITSFGFERTLQSEMDISETFDLLLSIQSNSVLFREWSLSDMQVLSQLLTVLKFGSGEPVIEAGEPSSFVAIVLSGALEVRLPGLGPDAPPIVLQSSSLNRRTQLLRRWNTHSRSASDTG